MNSSEKAVIGGIGLGLGAGLACVGAGWLLAKIIDKDPEIGKLTISGISEVGKGATDILTKKGEIEAFGEVVKFSYDVVSELANNEIDEEVNRKNRLLSQFRY
jgi:hypothetical protein